MSDDYRKYVRSVQEQDIRRQYGGQPDPDLFQSPDLDQGRGKGTDTRYGVRSGDVTTVDLSQQGLKSYALRVVGDFLQTINTQDTETPHSTGRDIIEGIRDARQGLDDLTDLMHKVLKIVDDLERLGMPEVGVDPMELVLEGIPGVSEAQLLEVLGVC